METKSKTRTQQILTVMQVLAWVAFVGYAVEAGVMLSSYVISGFNPEAAKDLYKGLSLYELRKLNFWYYTSAVSFLVFLSGMKSFIWLLVIKTLSKIKLKNPFTMEVAQKLERISYVLFATWLVGMLSSAYTAYLMKITGELFGTWVSGEFVFMAGLVFIISQIFKRGVEIQSENDLTV
jgi:Protein of unknown function (DUF2975)